MKILIVQIGKIGDMVLTTPMFRAIKEFDPGANIHVLASRRGAPLLRHNRRIEKIFVYRKDPLSLLFLLFKFRWEVYDWWVDPKDHESSEGAFLAKIGRAKRSVGFNGKSAGPFLHGLRSQEENFALHAAERNLFALSFLGIRHRNLRPELFTDARNLSVSRFAVDSRKMMVMNISAGKTSRCWENERWAELARRYLAKGFRVLLSSHPADQSTAKSIADACAGIERLHSPRLEDIIGLIQHAHVVVTPDTSMVHIAAAFDVPVVAFYPDVEWNFNKFRPLSTRWTALRPPKGKRIRDISAKEAADAIDGMLEEGNR